MKYCYTFYLIILTLNYCNNNLESILDVDNKIYDLGTIATNEMYNGFFILSNNTNKDIKIRDITPDCFCTEVNNTFSSIKANSLDTLFFTYHSRYPGPFLQRIIINCNAINSPILLIIRGKAI